MKKPFYTPNRNEKLAADWGYTVSNDGSVITGPNGNIYAQSRNSSGHLVFSFGPKKDRKKCQVHRFVAWFKFGEAIYEPNIVCRHLDGNPGNNHPDNIALGSQSDNMMDRPAKDRHSHAWNTSRHTLKHDHEAVIEFYKQNGFKKTMVQFGISSKGTLSFIINKTQTAKPVLPSERPKRKTNTTPSAEPTPNSFDTPHQLT